jgi:hypothetical protein
VVLWKFTDGPDERNDSIFRVGGYLNCQKRSFRQILAGSLRGLLFGPEYGGFTRLYGVTSQKLVPFIVTTVRTSNPTLVFLWGLGTDFEDACCYSVQDLFFASLLLIDRR